MLLAVTKLFRFLFIVFIIFLGVSFAVFNTDKVTVYYFGTHRFTLSLLLALTLGLGVVLGRLIGFMRYVRLKATYWRVLSRLKAIENTKSSDSHHA